MTGLLCSICGAVLPSDPLAGDPTIVRDLCPDCGKKTEQVLGPADTVRVVQPEASGVHSPSLANKQSTLFHPKLILRGEETPASSGPQSTQRPPALRPFSDACFVDLLSGEQYSLQGDCTVFNFAEPDLDRVQGIRADPCFQVEVMEREFFLKNLSEPNNLFLNGRKVGYCELRDGDELRLGDWVLRFQTIV